MAAAIDAAAILLFCQGLISIRAFFCQFSMG
jgi:hypothetical protein